MAGSAHFRASVGVLVRRGDGSVLALERLDVPGSWQAPQGGIDIGETPLEAAARELEEETGVSWADVELVAEHPSWLTYEFPDDVRSEPKRLGQTQRWFLVETDLEPDLAALEAGGEFRAWRWVSIDELVEDVWPPRRHIYESLRDTWRHLFA